MHVQQTNARMRYTGSFELPLVVYIYLQFVVSPIDNEGSDLLVHEQEDGGQDGKW